MNDPEQGIDSSFNTVFLIMPSLGLTTAELDAISASLASFVQSGRSKRVVLVGEFGSGFSAYNGLLNAVAEELGMKSSLFSRSNGDWDMPENYPSNPPCRVETGHYLMQGVTGLWDSAADYFAAGWETCTHPLAYLKDVPNQPWIVEQDTLYDGSRIAIHDSTFLSTSFNDVYDTVPDKNFRFVRNLCTIFPD